MSIYTSQRSKKKNISNLTKFVQSLNSVRHAQQFVVQLIVGARAKKETVAEGDEEVENPNNLIR